MVSESVLPESARSEAGAGETRGGIGEAERTSLWEAAHCCGLKDCAQQERGLPGADALGNMFQL